MKNKVRMRSVTQVGCAGARSVQEDFVAANREKGVFAMADGFGGPRAGDVAAKSACGAVLDFLQRESGDDDATFPFIRRSYYSLPANVLFNSVIHANRVVMKANKGKSVQERGGASLIAGYLDNGILSVAGVGACGAWLFRNGRWAPLLMPKTFARMIDPFRVDAPDGDELSAIPMAAVGMAEDLEPEIGEFFVETGDLLLIHSDGVSRRHRDQIAEVLGIYRSLSDVGEWMKQLFEGEAREGQLPDNSSVLLIQF